MAKHLDGCSLGICPFPHQSQSHTLFSWQKFNFERIPYGRKCLSAALYDKYIINLSI